MMLDSGRGFTVDSLAAEIAREFGSDARFHTCSADNLTGRELISFLQERGKFQPVEDGFEVARDRICRH